MHSAKLVVHGTNNLRTALVAMQKCWCEQDRGSLMCVELFLRHGGSRSGVELARGQ
jgi:hypothetical protein